MPLAIRWNGPCWQDATEEQEAEEAMTGAHSLPGAKVGGCRVPVSNPVLKVPTLSALETAISYTAFNVCFQFQLPPLHQAHSGGGDDHGAAQGRAVQLDRVELVLLKAPWVERLKQ